jgi:hypothetical protein
VDRYRRHPWVENLRKIKALPPCLVMVCPPEDKPKVRLIAASGKHGGAGLSTLPDLACGHWWISERFVAFAAEHPPAGNASVFKLS